MPNEQSTPQSVSADPNFQGLPLSEQTKVLARLDPDFASLAPVEQRKAASTLVLRARTQDAGKRSPDGETGIFGEQLPKGSFAEEHPYATAAAKGAGNLLLGAAKGAGSTLNQLGGYALELPARAAETGFELAGRPAPKILRQLGETPEKPAAFEPRGVMQNIGFGAEQGAEYVLPAGEVERGVEGVSKAIEESSKLAPVAKTALKLATRSAGEAVLGGGIGGLQGGKEGLETGVTLGAAAPVAAEAARPALERIPLLGGLIRPQTERMAGSPPGGEFHAAMEPSRQEVYDAARAHGIELTPGQASGAGSQQLLQALGERSATKAGDALRDLREANAQRVNRWAGELADRADPMDRDAGAHLKQSAQVALDIGRSNVRDAYRQVADAVPGVRVDLHPVRGRWGNELRKMDTVLRELPGPQAAGIRNLLESASALGKGGVTGVGDLAAGERGKVLIRAARGVPFDDAIRMRSSFLSLADDPNVPNQFQSYARQIAKSIDDAMDSSIQRAEKRGEISAGAAGLWRDANAARKSLAMHFEDARSPLARILREPDSSRALNVAASPGTTPNVIRELKSHGIDLGPLRREAVARMAGKNFSLAGGKIGGYSASYLRELFGDEGVRELSVLARTRQAIGYEMNPSGTGNVLLGEGQLSGRPREMISLAGAARVSNPTTPEGRAYREMILGGKRPGAIRSGRRLAPALLIGNREADVARGRY